MKKTIQCSLSLLIFAVACSGPDKSDLIIENIRQEYIEGNFTRASMLRDSLLKVYPGSIKANNEADSLIEISLRIKDDFSLSHNQIIQQLRNIPGMTDDSKIKEWEDKKWLEFRMIDGEKRYFNRAASNLYLLKGFYEDKDNRAKTINEDPRMKARKQHSEEIIQQSGSSSLPVENVKMKITYTLTVAADAVPAGETVRCWLPWPKGNHPRQSGPHLISVSEPEYLISDDSLVHRTLFMEKKAIGNQPTVFSISFNYSSSGQHFSFERIKAGNYDKSSELFREYTSAQPPQINFNNAVKNLADSITGPTDDPKTIVNKIYMWFKANIPWTGALEYSTMADIPGYVIENRRGDCGMQTFLFMSMLRYKGVPVKWQSGWMVPPGAENLHDWCEVWFEGTGWVPVDVSYDLQDSGNKEVREFYLSGIDSYRMIVNDGISGELYPPKKYLRSEPFDFQRGEVEWSGSNLYFDKWDYEMEIEYLTGKN